MRSTVTILDAAGNTVATLLRDRPWPATNSSRCAGTDAGGTAHGYTVVAATDGTTIVAPRNTGALAPAANTACT